MDFKLSHTGEQLDQAIEKVLNDYADVSTVTAESTEVLSGKIIVNALGVEVVGTIPSKSEAIITPSESEQEIAEGQYLSGKQIIAAMPSTHKNVSTVTAVGADVLSGKIIVDASGLEIVGTIPSKSTATITPSESVQEINEGQYLSGVQIIEAIPLNYRDTSTTDVIPSDILVNKKAVNTTGIITGTMPDNRGTIKDVIATNDAVGGYINMPVPKAGYYNTLSKLRESYADIASLIGLETGKIKSGSTIIGVNGDPNVVDTSSGDAGSADITIGKKAWVSGIEITGTSSGGGTPPDSIVITAVNASKRITAIDLSTFTEIYPYLCNGSAYSALISMILPDTLTAIGPYAFYNIATLSMYGIPMPDGIKSIGAYAFYGCSVLQFSSLPINVESIGNYAFYNCYNALFSSLPETITYIGAYAFYSNQFLSATSIPSNLTSIGASAFEACHNLAATSLPSGLTTIAVKTFYNCPNLALSSFPSGLTSIGDDAFRGCSKITATSLPSNLTSIGSRAFYGCTKLALTSLPDGVTVLTPYSFYGCTSLALTSLPGLISISTYVFNGCITLRKIWIPASCTTITAASAGAAPFYNCSDQLIFFCEVTSKPAGWGTYWDNRTSTLKHPVVWGVSKSDFDAMYIWDKYVATLGTTYTESSIDNFELSIPFAGGYNVGTTKTLNSTTGLYELTGTVEIPLAEITALTEITSLTDLLVSGEIGATGLSAIYFVKSVVKDETNSVFVCQTIKYYPTLYSKGAIVAGGTVASTLGGDYPIDGYADQSWYVRRI